MSTVSTDMKNTFIQTSCDLLDLILSNSNDLTCLIFIIVTWDLPETWRLRLETCSWPARMWLIPTSGYYTQLANCYWPDCSESSGPRRTWTVLNWVWQRLAYLNTGYIDFWPSSFICRCGPHTSCPVGTEFAYSELIGTYRGRGGALILRCFCKSSSEFCWILMSSLKAAVRAEMAKTIHQMITVITDFCPLSQSNSGVTSSSPSVCLIWCETDCCPLNWCHCAESSRCRFIWCLFMFVISPPKNH